MRKGEEPMLSTAEKVALLRTVSIFKGIAAIAYIIVESRVRAHDGERTLNDLEVAHVFGEMALLDAEPRWPR
jgi:hypothetical protein